MPWTGKALLEWFVVFHASEDGRRASRSVSYRCGVADSAEDLHQNWYLSIRGTVDRLVASGGQLPAWLDDEDGAIRYVLRGLHNDAVDLGRIQSRRRQRFVAAPDPSVLIDITDHAASPDEAVTLDAAVDAVRDEVLARHRAGRLGSPQCRGERAVGLALGVLERLTGLATSGGSAPVKGAGTDEWDRLVYEVLNELDPDRFTPGPTGMSAAARQMKVRCGNHVRQLLGELLARHFPEVIR